MKLELFRKIILTVAVVFLGMIAFETKLATRLTNFKNYLSK